MKPWIVGLVIVSTFGVLGAAAMWASIVNPEPSSAAQLPSLDTIVCGKFAAPPFLAGTPMDVIGTTISFADGYLLQLKEVPSMFIGRRALFQMTDGKVTYYGIVAEDYNPCPAKP